MDRLRFDDGFFGNQNRHAAEKVLPEAGKALDQLIDKSCVGSEFTAWFDWPKNQGFKLVTELETFKKSYDIHYDLVVVIGIGGSYAGTKAVVDALSHKYAAALSGSGATNNDGRKHVVYAGHNLSEAELVELMDLLEKRQPIINVISKSGTTTEPSVAFRVIQQYMEKRFGEADANRRIIAITDEKKGALRELSTEKKYKTFIVPDDVGGRYSVLTAVGLVPLMLSGYNVSELLQGADELFSELRGGSESSGGHAVLKYAASRKVSWDSGKRIEILAFGEPKLTALVDWWKQLFGESEGKNGLGLYPSSLSCTTDLHSLGQYIQDGCRNLVETFLSFDDSKATDSSGVERRMKVPQVEKNLDGLRYLESKYLSEINDAAMLGTKIAHSDGGVPCMGLSLSKLDERNIGYLFAFYESACAVSAALLEVNPFDQPGVEDYKTNLFGLMGKPGFEEIGTKLKGRI